MDKVHVTLNHPVEIKAEDRERLLTATYAMWQAAESAEPGWLAAYVRAHKAAHTTIAEIFRRATATPDVPRADDH